MVFEMESTYDEILEIMDVKYTPPSTLGYTLPPGVNEISDIALKLKSLFPIDVKVIITIDDIRLKAKLTTNKTIRFTGTSFFYVFLGFAKSHSGFLGDSIGLVQLFPGT